MAIVTGGIRGICAFIVLALLDAVTAGAEVLSDAAPLSEPIPGVGLSRLQVFAEPMIPSEPPTARESQKLAGSIEIYRRTADKSDTSALEAYLRENPHSVYRASLWLNIGLARLSEGMDTLAGEALEVAWKASRGSSDANVLAINQRAVAELLFLHTRLGHPDIVETWLARVDANDARGIASPAASIATMGLWDMRTNPETAMQCGWISLQSLLRLDASSESPLPPHPSPTRRGGYSMAELIEIAQSLDRNIVAVRRDPAQPVPVPSVAHWSSGHFSYLAEVRDGRYLVRDPTLRSERWMSQTALDTESSGYFLVERKAASENPQWAAVARKEASGIRGAGSTSAPDPQGNPCEGECCDPCSGAGGPSGMPTYRVNPVLIGVVLQDTPLSYTPPKGPAIGFTLTYNQKDSDQPTTFTYGNVGPKWTFNWIEYIQDNPAQAGSQVMLYLPGGQGRNYSGYNATTQAFAREPQTGAILYRVSASPIKYERRQPDGSKQVFEESDGNTAYPRRVFLTKRIDAKGNEVTLGYDSSHRLSSITDATGQVSTIQYNGKASLLISGISDPFGRTASLSYDSSGRLSSITDAIGMTSDFGYGSGSTITSLTTPYGTTQFEYSTSGTYSSGYLRLDTTDVAGNVSRYEFRHAAPGVSSTDTVVPSCTGNTCGMALPSSLLQYRNSFYWDAHVFGLHTPVYTEARIQHWLHTSSGLTSDVLESIKLPLERRTWYTYYGTSSSYYSGNFNKPRYTGRVLADGSTQRTYNVYNAQGNTTRTIDPVDLETLTTYAANGIDPIQITRSGPGGYSSVESFTYDGNHNVLTHTDEAGQIWTYTYNAAGQRQTTTDPLNHVTTHTYDTDGYLLSVTDANNHVQVSYTYDAIGRIATETDAANTTKTYTYDALNRITRIDYWDGSYEENTWDKLDRVAHRNREGEITNYAYDGMRNLVSLTDPDGNLTSFTYYRNNLLHTRTDPDGGVTTWTRDIQGRVTAVEDPNGHVTTYIYDETGRKTSETNALNQTTTYGHDANDRLIRTQDANGVKTDRGYHPRGWLLTSTVRADPGGTPHADDAIATWAYDALGNPVSITDPDGVITAFTYDAAHRLTTVTDGAGNHLNYTLDAVGNRLTETTYDTTNTSTRSLSRTFDARNLIATETDALSQTASYGYDPDHRRIAQTDRRGIVTHWNYDAEGRLIQTVQDVGGTDPGTGDATTAFAYDAAGRLIEVTDPNGLATAYTLDPMGRVEALDSPDTGLTATTYDAAGNRLTQTDARSITATSSYDALHRITATTYPDSSQNVSYSYDQPDGVTGCSGSFPIGRLTGFTDASGSTTYCYDHRGNVTRKTQVTGTLSLTTQYGYTLGDRLDTLTYPDGTALTYTRNALGQITAITQTDTNPSQAIVTNATYLPFGPIEQIAFAGGASQDFAYDGNYRMTDLDGTALNLQFRFNEEGNLIDAEDGDLGAAVGTRNYDYDALSRLISVIDGYSPPPGGPGTMMSALTVLETFTYDATGNRLSKYSDGMGTAQTYVYPLDSHRLSAIDSQGRTYDAMGNLTGVGSQSFTYGANQRLKQVGSGAAQVQYQHNAKGERVRKLLGQQINVNDRQQYHYAYDEQGHLLTEYHRSAGTPQPTTLHRQYAWLDDRPVAVKATDTYANEWQHIHTDHLGAPRAISRPAGSNATIWRWELTGTAFGEHAPEQDVDGDSQAFVFNLRYPGQYFDAESGLHYNYFRDYEPGTGRHPQPDPVGLNGGISLYSYVEANPIRYIDALGLHKGDKWYGFNDREFQRWFHRCWKQPGDPDADKDGIAEAFAEWDSRGRPGNGKCDNFPPPPPVPAPMCDDDCRDTVATVVVAGGTAYVIYRCARMVPSLFPPLWPTIPANLVVP